jgi:hypothetical protein
MVVTTYSLLEVERELSIMSSIRMQGDFILCDINITILYLRHHHLRDLTSLSHIVFRYSILLCKTL